MTPSAFILSILCGTAAVLGAGNTYTIHNASEFVQFSNKVTAGTDFAGTTVFLDSDINITEDLSSQFEMIGKDGKYFNGVFDGKGHVLSNAHVNSTQIYVGMFGISHGLTIRNFVVDSSCSVTSTYASTYSYVHLGGFLGCCSTSERVCYIQNSVNMATVSYKGSAQYETWIGGIVGHAQGKSYNVYVTNCANYGTVLFQSTSSVTYIGGITGCSNSNYAKYIQNCVNYGTLIHNGTSKNGYSIGGMVGGTYKVAIDIVNSLNDGKIITGTGKNYNANIAGNTTNKVVITHCFWTGDTNNSLVSGNGKAVVTNSSLVEPNLTTVKALSDYSAAWSNWTLNAENNTVTFLINGSPMLSTSEQIILLPDLMDTDPFTFSGWYTDPYCTVLFEEAEVSNDTVLYGLYGAIVTITFDDGYSGGSSTSGIKRVVSSGAYGDLPDVVRSGYTFEGWFIDGTDEEVNSSSIVSVSGEQTIRARWVANKYEVSFDVNGGDSLSESTKEFTYDGTYSGLPEPTRTGYTFDGWFIDGTDEKITESSTVSITEDKTFKAKWSANKYEVSFDVNGGDSLSESTKEFTYDGTYAGLPEPTRTGYSFDGWFIDGTDEKITSETTVSITEDKTFTARWVVNSYEVSFDYGNGTIARVLVEYNKPVQYPESISREGYTFDGWDKDSVTAMPAENLTVTAKWVANKYEVSFDVNGGDILSEPTKEFTYDGTYSGLPEPTRTGYSFDGWFIDGTDEKITESSTVSITEDKIFTARWVANKYEVSFDYGNGTVARVLVEYESEIEYPEGLVKEGYMFNGWKPKPRTMPAENTNIEAQWVLDTCFVKVVLGTAELSESEIADVLGKHTSSEFTIERVDIDASEGTTIVIVKFNDAEEASDFVDKVEEAVKGGEDDYLRGASLVPKDSSYSPLLYPFAISLALLLLFF